jgi:aldose 1-epimerase
MYLSTHEHGAKVKTERIVFMSIEKSFFGTTKDGGEVYNYDIINAGGSRAGIITYGGTLCSLLVPDKNGVLTDVLLGFDDMEGHEERSAYQGQLVGRYANRLANGSFTVNGIKIEVTKNENGETCLHGGGELSHAVWTAEIAGENSLRLTYTGADNKEGFPGVFTAEVLYTFTDENEIIIDYRASCTEDTVINLTNHAYFNLAGFDGGDVLDHELSIDADYFTPTDKKSIPTGEIRAVGGTAFDFRNLKPIGLDIGANDEQLISCRGYDHNFCLNKRPAGAPAARVRCPRSGISMEMFTDMPGVQLYTGNFLDGEKGKGGTPVNKHAGFCLETQFYPDTPNHLNFPQCTFLRGELFVSRTSYKFYSDR